MDSQDSEPLFGDDVYHLLRDDSLLHRTGSTNFAMLLDQDSNVPQNLPNETQIPHSQTEQQLKTEPREKVTEPIGQDQQGGDGTLLITEQELNQEGATQPEQSKSNVVLHQGHKYILYQSPGSSSNAGEVVLISSNDHSPSTSNDQIQPLQGQQQIACSWDAIDGDNDLVENTNINRNNSLMTLLQDAIAIPPGNIFADPVDDANLPPDTTGVGVVPSVQPWAGRYDFNISLPTGNKDRTKWCYSETNKKLYLCPNLAVPVTVTLSQWVDANITITPVFQASRYRMEPVNRCYNCRSKDNCDSQLGDHLVQIEGEGCVYETVLERNVVKVPLQRPPPGEVASILLVKLMCLTSCVGGPNRRPFYLVMTLRCNLTGHVIGRQVLDIKCCKCPFRDLTNDEGGLMNEFTSQVRKLSSQVKVEQKKKKPKIKAEPGTEMRYVNIAVPVEYELQVKSYVNGLIAKQYMTTHQPNVLLYPEEKE